MICGLVLAAGRSRRMGRPKLSLRLGSSTVLEITVATLLRAGLPRVVVVLAEEGEDYLGGLESKRVRIVVNASPEEGMASSIRAGIPGLEPSCRAVALTLGDKPLVRVETVQALVRRFDEGDVVVVQPVFQGSRGHPVIFSARLFGALSRLEGDSGARSLVSRHQAAAAAIPVEDEGVVLDIDTAADYALALDRYRSLSAAGTSGGNET